MTNEFITNYISNKMSENTDFIRITFYELRIKNNLSEEDTDEFLRFAMTYLENKGYDVYVGNARYTYKNANQLVQPNELLIAFKND